METQLPATIGLSVASALQRYPEWQGVARHEAPPEMVGLLGDQANNCSVLVANSRSFVIRVNRNAAATNALDPGAEQAALIRAAQAGLAPALRFFDAKAGIMVCDYLPPEGSSRASPVQLGQLIKGIHELEPIEQHLSLPERIRHYQSGVARNDAGELPVAASTDPSLLASAIELESRDRKFVLCHNDLLPPNCVFSQGRLWAIDWEYAAMGSRWFDLAAASCGHELQPQQQFAMLEAYLGHRPGNDEKELFELAHKTYSGIERLWHKVNAAESKSG